MKLNPTPSTTRQRPRGPLPERAVSTRARPSLRLEDRRERLARTRARGHGLQTFFHAAITLTGVALLTSCVVSLVGNVMLESSRRQSIEIAAQLRIESAGGRELKAEVASASGAQAVNRWAFEHGFIAQDTETRPATDDARVALR